MAGRKILIVDYDTPSRDALAALFQPLCLEILTASDGLAAYEIFRIEKPDVVLLEAILPRLHGFDLAKRIIAESHGAVPVVIVTGLYRGPHYRHEALTSLGAAGYFEKPYDSAKLVRTVLDLFKEKEEPGFDLPRPEAVISFLADRLKKDA
jgi:DNA-binding response OmpR family regulator